MLLLYLTFSILPRPIFKKNNLPIYLIMMTKSHIKIQLTAILRKKNKKVSDEILENLLNTPQGEDYNFFSLNNYKDQLIVEKKYTESEAWRTVSHLVSGRGIALK